jgi:hypothetical protein
MHAFKGTTSKRKIIFANFEICRKILEKNFELLRVNTSSHMRAKHPFIDEAD